MASRISPPRAHVQGLAQLMHEATGEKQWRKNKLYRDIHEAVGGALAEQHAISPLHGAGLFDWFSKAKNVVSEAVGRVKNAFSGARDGYSPSAKAAIDKYASWTITSLTVRRDPIQSALNSALNLVSLGKWDKSRAEHGFDKLFHLGLVIGLQSPTGQHHDLLFEKNAVINIGNPKAVNDSTEIMRVPSPSPPETLGVFLDKAQKDAGAKYFAYDAFTNNCQDAIRGALKANGVLTSQADAFLKQDLEKVIREQPGHLGHVAKAVTDLGARFDRVVQGGAVHGRCYRCGSNLVVA